MIKAFPGKIKAAPSPTCFGTVNFPESVRSTKINVRRKGIFLVDSGEYWWYSYTIILPKGNEKGE